MDRQKDEILPLESAYRSHCKTILSLSFHYTGNLQQAEEIMQEVFISYGKNISKIQSPEHVLPWLRRVAINKSFDLKRRAKTAFNYVGNMLSMGSEDTSGNDQVDNQNDLNIYLQKIDHKSRMILILKYLQDMNFDEIAKELNIPVGTVKSLSSRALKKLNNQLEKPL